MNKNKTITLCASAPARTTAVRSGGSLRWILLLATIPSLLHAADFYTVRTGSMRLVYYSPDHAFIIPHLTRSFQNALSFESRLFHYALSEDVVVYLQDFDDYGYAGATSMPINYMILGISPYEYTYETSPTNERINWVIGHELMHIVASDKAAGSDLFFRSLFAGKVVPTDDEPPSILYSYLTSPRKYSPRWYHEGIAVFMETWLSGGIGRAQNGWDEMVFRTMVRDSAYFYDFVGLESEGTTVDFQIGANSYLYGTRFVSYLADRYGPEKIVEWFDRGPESSPTFSGQFDQTFNKDLDDEWSAWIEAEKTFQQANLDSIRKYPVTPLHALTAEPLGAVSRGAYDPATRTLYCGVNEPGVIAHVTALNIDTGERRWVCEIATPSLYNVASTAYAPALHTFFFTTKNSKGWRDLKSVDISTGEVRELLKNARIGDLAFNASDSSLWGVQHHTGISRLVRIPPPYTTWQEILPLKYGVDLYDPDIAPDGSALVASMMEINGRQRLVRITMDSLMSGSVDYEVLHEFESTAPLNFVYSADGRSLYGSTYYTGVSNLVRYDFATHAVEWLTNVETGIFRPVPLSADSLIAFSYTRLGFVPVTLPVRPTVDVSAIRYLGAEIADHHPVVRSWKLPPPSPTLINVDSLIVTSGDYEGLGAFGLRTLYPVVHGYKTSLGAGLRLNFFDPLLMHNLNLSLLYTPNPGFALKERFHAMLQYSYWQWEVSARYNESDFYDIFGPQKSSRRGAAVSVGYSDVLKSDRPATTDYTLRVSGYSDIDRLPGFQNVSATVNRFTTFLARLKHSRVLRSLGSVDAETGHLWSITGYAYLSAKRFNPTLSGTFDLGFLLDRNHTSLWFRTAAGYAIGSSADPFANFFFGGFGNNYVDHGPERQYRDASRFPGQDFDDIAGKTFTKGMVELALPPLRFRRFGVSGFYCTWARAALFTTGLLTNLQDGEMRTFTANAGVQIDLKMVLFSNLSSVLSFGYAVAGGRGRTMSDEIMASLKIL
jgi:hypothetical protein